MNWYQIRYADNYQTLAYNVRRESIVNGLEVCKQVLTGHIYQILENVLKMSWMNFLHWYMYPNDMTYTCILYMSQFSTKCCRPSKSRKNRPTAASLHERKYSFITKISFLSLLINANSSTKLNNSGLIASTLMTAFFAISLRRCSAALETALGSKSKLFKTRAGMTTKVSQWQLEQKYSPV